VPGYDKLVMSALTGKQRRFLRALAHDSKPVVQIGHAGLTPAVTAAIQQALLTHELIKIKVSAEAGYEAAALGPEIEQKCQAQLAQVIGRTLLVYRQRERDPKIKLPRAGAKGEPSQAKEPS
jgi:RNA-binding protein